MYKKTWKNRNVYKSVRLNLMNGRPYVVIAINKSGELFTCRMFNSASSICNENSAVYNTSYTEE
jgi:hypothetical protein